MQPPTTLARYDIHRSYDWNYEQTPEPVAVDVPELSGNWEFLGMPVASPLGVPAGPLLNGKWCLYYASLGFDVLTYKTVRSGPRACYPLPNLQPVRCGTTLAGGERDLEVSESMEGSWAVSFGMPSKAPEVWRRDIEATKAQLPQGKLLSVSVVGTIQDGWTIEDLAADYARCAEWAVQSGADVVETNFSCPNVSTCDGQLYQTPADARLVAECVRQTIGQTPYLIKVGHVTHPEAAQSLVESVGEFVDGLAMTNSVATTVRDRQGDLMFAGDMRGICGAATRVASTAQVATFADLIRQGGTNLKIVGVGGAGTAKHVLQYLDAGADAVHIATAAMVDPWVAIEIKRELAG